MPHVTLFIDSLGSGGAQRQVIEMAAALPRFGWQVAAVWYNDVDHFYDPPAIEGVERAPIPRSGRGDPRFFARIRSQLSKSRTDVVHAFLDRPAMYAALARSFAGAAPLITAVRCSSAAFEEDRNVAAMYVGAAHLSDHVTVNAADVVDWLVAREVHEDRISHVPNVIPSAIVKRTPSTPAQRSACLGSYGLSDNEPPIVMMGRFDEYKNQDGLLRAVKLLTDRGNKVPPVLLIGAPSHPERMTKLRAMACAPAMPKVVLAPPTADPWTVMEAARLVALTSHSEGTPNVLLEALGLGCHAMAVPVGDVPLLVVKNKTGVLARSTSDDAIADALESALTMTPEAVDAMCAAARDDVVARFDAQAVVGRMDALYRRVMTQTRPPRISSTLRAIKHLRAAL